MELPKITIVTVTYNLIKDGRKEFFKQCCESVANQTYPNIEHLIIDGASTDGTLELIEECRHPRMRVISEPDDGMWDAMDKAIDYTRGGGYLNYMNSDDYFFKNDVIEKCMNKLMETGADACVGNFRYRYKDDTIISEFHENIPPIRREQFWRSMHYNHETLICKVDVYKKLGKHNLKYKTCIDYYWNIQLVLNGCSICTVNDIIFYGRAGGSSTTEECTSSDATIKNVANLWKDLWDFYPLTDEECKKMLVETKFPLEFLHGLVKHINELDLKNFDYDFFNNMINTAIDNQFKDYIIKTKLTKEILKLLSVGEVKKIKEKYKRLRTHLINHPKHYDFLKNIIMLLHGGKPLISVPW